MTNKKILITHLSRLGDMIQSLPAVKLLKEDNPESIITYLGIEDFCHLLKGISWIDRLVTLPWREISAITNRDNANNAAALDRLFKAIPELNENYDILINLTHNWSSSYLSQKVKAAEKTGRIFSKNDEIVVSGNWGKYLFAVARNRRDNLLNLVDIYMGMAGTANRPVANFLPVDPELDRVCISRLTDLGFNRDRPSIGFQLGASKAMRTWPLKNFVKLGEYLTEDLDAQIILIGSEKERILAEEFRSSARFPFIDLIGKTKLTELTSYLRAIDLLISNDTGPIHIAAAVGTKVVGIFISTAHFGITGPYGDGHVVVQSRYPCAPCLDSTACSNPLCRKSIKPGAALQAVKLALNMEVELSNGDPGANLYKSCFHKNGTLRYELINRNGNHFLPWLSSFHDLKGSVSQTLWDRWLGLESNIIDIQSPENNTMLSDITGDFQEACSYYSNIYKGGMDACRSILNEFQKKRPNFRFIQKKMDSLTQAEEEIKNLEGPLPILREIHELHIAETEICDFPKLAREFLDKYKILADIVKNFDSGLQEI